MKELLLARHGEAGSNEAGTVSGRPPGPALTAEGVVQGRRLAADLAATDVGLGVCTEFLRTQETLALALHGRDVPRVELAELNEIAFGRFDGGPLAAYREWAWTTDAALPAPGGGESRAQVAARIARGLAHLSGRQEETILVVGHALPVRYVVDAAAGRVPAARIDHVEHATVYRLDTAAVLRAAGVLRAWSEDPVFRAAVT